MLKVNQQLIDLGTIKFGKVYTFEYEITNTVGNDIPIDKVRVSCSSCTQATLPKKIKGNETVTMKVTYTPGVIGPTSKAVDVLYDGDQVLKVQFKAEVNE